MLSLAIVSSDFSPRGQEFIRRGFHPFTDPQHAMNSLNKATLSKHGQLYVSADRQTLVWSTPPSDTIEKTFHFTAEQGSLLDAIWCTFESETALAIVLESSVHVFMPQSGETFRVYLDFEPLNGWVFGPHGLLFQGRLVDGDGVVDSSRLFTLSHPLEQCRTVQSQCSRYSTTLFAIYSTELEIGLIVKWDTRLSQHSIWTCSNNAKLECIHILECQG